VQDREKGPLIEAGRWRAKRPDVQGHAGFRLTSLVSTLENASWLRLAAEFLQTKRHPTTLKPWVNTVLGEAWRDRDGEEIDETGLLALREPIGLDRVPPEALYLTAGVDVQKDRLEIATLGWHGDGTAVVLGHEVLWGDPTENDLWIELDELLRRDFRHPRGGSLRYDCAFVDAGDGNMSSQVYSFAHARTGRRIFACRGAQGFTRPFAERSRAKRGLFFVVGWTP
jgi:phage terminase large subunit GpA-like protein